MSGTLEIRNLVDDAARQLGFADVMLGDDGYSKPEVEALLLSALNLTLHALEMLRRK